MKREERAIQARILDEFGRYRWMRLWRQNTGTAISIDSIDPWKRGIPFRAHFLRFIKFGLPGSADLSGVLAPDGRRLEIECKSPDERQKKKQQAYQRVIEQLGGIYIVARSTGDVWDALRAAGYPKSEPPKAA